MFRKNEQHRQKSFFSAQGLLPTKLRERLLTSWAQTFYELVLCQIDETIFAPLYSDKASRPNVPVNVLVALDILKSGFGWSDRVLYQQVCFNLQVRHALGLHDLRAEVFALKTLYNFRRRIRDYADETGINLMEKVFEQITDEHLDMVAVVTGWQRMDSSQILSNLAEMSRLELLVAVLQAVHKRLPDAAQASWGERWSVYLEGRPHQVCYKIPSAEVEEHLATIGQELNVVEALMTEQAPDSDALALVKRVLEEQYEQDTDGTVRLRPSEEISTDSLQSPHDGDATYRIKGGKRFRGGYVINVSETADPENSIQLITDVQVEPNQTDDAQLMEQSLDDQAEREIEVDRVTTDGGYTGPRGEAACEKHDVELRATRMRGGRSAANKWGWEEYTWEVDGEGTPTSVTCPRGCKAALLPGQADGRFIARFDPECCADCRFFKNLCRAQDRRQVGPTLYVQARTIEVARQRQNLHPEDTPIRVLAESTVRSLKRGFPNNKLPVRGLIRSRMMIYPAAVMVNLRRLHRHFAEMAQEASQVVASSLFSVKNGVFRHSNRIHRRLSRLLVVRRARQAAVSSI